MEHLGSSGPFPTELRTCLGSRAGPVTSPGIREGVEAVLSTQSPLAAQPPGPPALSSLQMKLASHRGGPTASDATCRPE